MKKGGSWFGNSPSKKLLRPHLKEQVSWAPVARAHNSSYLGGRNQEDHSLKPVPANSSQDPISKIPNTKRAGRVAQAVGPEFKPQYQKKQKKVRCDGAHL
jgi:hypothetical protein